jgi:carbon monoxide dehydrogenase subunit G
MPKVTVSEHIQASPEVVWEMVSDIERGPEWVTVMKEVTYLSDTSLRKGSVYREMSQVGPKLSETEWHITRFDAPHVQVHESHSKEMEVVLTVTINAEKGGTRLLHETEYRMMPGFRPLGWLLEKLVIQRVMTKGMNQSVANFKKMVERPLPAAVAA